MKLFIVVNTDMPEEIQVVATEPEAIPALAGDENVNVFELETTLIIPGAAECLDSKFGMVDGECYGLDN